MTKYTDTTGVLARKAGVAQRTVAVYCNLALLDFITLENGTRLLRVGQAQRAREIYAKRLANRGRGPRHAGPEAA